MNTPLGSLLNLERQVRDAVVAASGRLAEDWQARKSVSFKAVADPVTEHDIAIENALRQRLEELLPQAGFIVEEGESVRSEQYNWVIDPIDQTKNFIGQTPMFFTQVALVEDGTPILGVIYNPVSRQLLSASRGNGATMNGNPVAQIKEQALSEVVVDVDFGDSSHLTWKIQIIEKVARSASRLRITGGAYAPYLLTGGIGAFLVVNQATKPMDQLPRMAVARESGLAFEEHSIEGYMVLAAGHPSVVRELLECIKR